jgi:DNA-binding IclR family transcriptional regulator
MVRRVNASRTSTSRKSDTAPRSAAGRESERYDDERYMVPALIRGLAILRMLSDARGRLTLSEIAASLGVTRSSAYRLLYTLVHLGFVTYDEQAKSYALGSQILHLGYSYLASRDLVEVAMPHLVALRDRTGWSAHLGELQGREVVYIARVATRRSVASTIHVGTRLPAHATTMGRVLLSSLSDRDVRALYQDAHYQDDRAAQRGGKAIDLRALLEQLHTDQLNGFVVQNGGYEPGVASVAAPIRDVSDRVIAAINISAIALFTSDAELSGALKADVVATAAAISQDLGRRRDVGEDFERLHGPQARGPRTV